MLRVPYSGGGKVSFVFFREMEERTSKSDEKDILRWFSSRVTKSPRDSMERLFSVLIINVTLLVGNVSDSDIGLGGRFNAKSWSPRSSGQDCPLYPLDLHTDVTRKVPCEDHIHRLPNYGLTGWTPVSRECTL